MQNIIKPAAQAGGGNLVMPAKQNVGDRNTMPTDSNGLMSMSRASEPSMRTTSQPTQRPAIPTGPTALPQRYEPTKGRVADNALVENRIQGLMSMDNPLMKKSVINANNLSAQRGLQSSSIATENAVNSMFNYAMPIAQQDAQTMAQQGFMDQDQRQQVGMENNRALNQGVLNNRQNEFVADQSQRDRDLSVQIEDLRNQNALGQLDRQGQIRLEQMEIQNQFTAEQSGLDRAFATEIEGLRYQNSLGLLDREGQLRLDQMEVQNNFTAGQSALDRGFAKELEGLRNQNSQGLLTQEGQQRLEQLEVQNRFSSSENTVQREFTRELEDLKNQSNLGLLNREGQQRLEQLDKQNEFAEKQMNISSNLQNKRDETLQGFQQDNTKLDFANRIIEIETQAKANTQIQGEQNNFRRQLEYSNAVSNATNFGIEAMGNAFMNPEITPDQYDSVRDNIMSMVNGQVKNFQDIYGVSTSQGPAEQGPNISTPAPNQPAPPERPNPSNPAMPSMPNKGLMSVPRGGIDVMRSSVFER